MIETEEKPKEISVVKLQELETRGRELTRMADEVVVRDRTSWLSAGEFVVKLCNTAIKEVEDCFDDPIATANKLHKDLCAKRKKYLLDPTDAKQIVDRKRGRWEQEEDRRVQEEQRKAAEERERIERLEREKREQEEKARQEAQRQAELAAKKAQEENILRLAEEAEKSGDLEARDRILGKEIKPATVVIPRQPEMPPPPTPTIPPPIPKIEGEAKVVTFKWRERNPGSIQGINPDYLMIDEAKIGKLVRNVGMEAERIVGAIEVYEEYGYRRTNGS